ncbi:MAG: (Fe-S)-binding protein [Chitinophagaceae bacterium]|nr:MAG: (Fe-S)-binding protein [Chitinophagaceae bacterium]
MTGIIQQIVFVIVLIGGITIFSLKMKKIIRNIKLGKDLDLSGNTGQRIKKMLLIAFGQKKMFKNLIPAFFHLLIYIGFIIINIEILEIILDGILGKHRIFFSDLGMNATLYSFIINTFEFLALGVIIACVAFLIRRHFLGIKRFQHSDLKRWPKLDADIILYVEIVLMGCFLFWNASDQSLQKIYASGGGTPENAAIYVETGTFYLSSLLMPLLSGMGEGSLILLERTMWWGHIVGILIFLNYIPYSKHFHIMMAFPNTYFSRLQPQGEIYNMPEITREIEMMMNPDAAQSGEEAPPPSKFGAKDVTDLNWKNLLDAYSCTECGRCTAACPANQTGKLLSPRKIMMDTRDRLEEIGNNIDKKGADFEDGKSLVSDEYITEEELRACTTCNACVEECPININPLDIIYELRRNLIMEESKAPGEWNSMFTNIENNAAPWQFSQQDRLKWKDDLNDENK